MRVNHVGTTAELMRLAEALHVDKDEDVSVGRFVANLHAFNRILFRNPLVRAAVAALMEDGAEWPDPVAGGIQRLVERVLPTVNSFVNHLQQRVNRLGHTDPAFEDRLAGLRDAPVQWRGRTRSRFDTLTAVLSEDLSKVSFDELRQLDPLIIRPIFEFFAKTPAASFEQPEEANTADRASAILDLLGNGLEHLAMMDECWRELSMTPNVEALLEFERSIRESLADDAPIPLPQDSPLGSLFWDPFERCVAVGEQAWRTAQVLRARLEQGPVRQHVIARLVSYLEFFGRDALLARLNDRGDRKPEDIIQDEVDRFVFAEGLFPITHAVAGHGRIDTFVDVKTAHLFSTVRETQQLPVLIEIKQALKADKRSPTQRRVESAVSLALEQAAEYRRHVQANLRWADHRITVLVVYDGPRRYRSRNGSVRLVYLGKAPPSDGSTLLAV
jgi:hypothetical protein